MSQGEGRGASIPPHSDLLATAVIVMDRPWEHGDGPGWGWGRCGRRDSPACGWPAWPIFRNHFLHLEYLHTPPSPPTFPLFLSFFSLPLDVSFLPAATLWVLSRIFISSSQFSHTPSSPSTSPLTALSCNLHSKSLLSNGVPSAKTVGTH